MRKGSFLGSSRPTKRIKLSSTEKSLPSTPPFHLPNELWQCIFYYCSLDTLIALQQTCKQCRVLLHRTNLAFWRNFCDIIWNQRYTSLPRNFLDFISYKHICLSKIFPYLVICHDHCEQLILSIFRENGLENVQSCTNPGELLFHDLRKYFVIMVIGDYGLFKSSREASKFGNILAHYVDSKLGGVICFCFSNSYTSKGGYILGNFAKKNYFPIGCSHHTTVQSTKAQISHKHFITFGIKKKSIQLSSHVDHCIVVNGKIHEDAKVIAECNGIPMIALIDDKRIASVNLYLPFHCDSKDVIQIVINLLMYLSTSFQRW